MTPIIVTSTMDPTEAGKVTLRDAINTANTDGVASIIEFDPSVFTASAPDITLTTGTSLSIKDNDGDLTIQATGGAKVAIDGAATSTVFQFNNNGVGSNLSLEGLTIQNGKIGGNGGGIRHLSNGTLTLRNSTVTGNVAGGNGGGIYALNTAGPVNIENTTISGNRSGANGGGVYASSGTINNSTVSGNTAGNATSLGNGGGLYSGTSLTLRNSIVAGNVDGNTAVSDHPDVSGTFVPTNNVIGDTNGSSNFADPADANVALDDLGLTAADVIGPLANNGGTT